VNQLESEERFRRLYSDHVRSILDYALRRTSSQIDALDVVADTMLVAWRRIDEIPEEPESLLWLYGVARNVVANENRARRRRSRLGAKIALQLGPVAISEEQLDPGLAAHVRESMLLLSEVEREIILLSASERLAPAEIAVALDMNSNTVRTHLRRARLKIRTELASRGALDLDDQVLQRTTVTGHEGAERRTLSSEEQEECDDERR